MVQVTDAYGKTFNIDSDDLTDFKRQKEYEQSLIRGDTLSVYNFDTTGNNIADINRQIAAAQAKAGVASQANTKVTPAATTTQATTQNRSTMFGGQLKDYTNLDNNRFQAYDLSQDGNTVGYSKYGNAAGSSIVITPEGKFRLNPNQYIAGELGVAATDFDTLDEAFGMLDRYNGDPANTFARYNAATQQGLNDTDANLYASDASYSNPAQVVEAREAETTRLAEEEKLAEEQRIAKAAEEAARIAVEKARTAEEARIAEEQRLAAEAESARLAEEQRIATETAARLAEEQRIAAEAAVAVPVQQTVPYTSPEFTPSTQTSSVNYAPTPYSPAAPTYTTPAQAALSTTQFSPQYVAGPVEQNIQLPSSGTTGITQTVMYKNQRGQQIPITEIDGKPMTYVPPGYTRMAQGGMVGYAEGGDVNLNAQYQLATKFLGYQGPKTTAGLNDFAKANPGAAARMGMYQQAMARGGMVRGLQEGGDNSDTTTGGASTSGDDDSFGYYKDVVPMFGDAVSQTMQPMQAPVSYITPTADQDIAAGTGQVGTYAPTVGAAQVYGVTQASTPTYVPSATYGAATTAEQVADQTAATPTITGEVSDEAKISAEQGVSSLNIDAAQGTATMMSNPVTREIQDGELISGAADAQKAAKFTEQIQAAQATPSKQATVQGQLEGLMQQFEGGDTPAWAAGAMRNALGAMAARGLGASSLAGQAAVQAAMESALPIAQADAQTIASFEAQNLSNRQQRAMLGAQQRAQFMGQEFDQAFQARVQNSSRIADIANMNFTAEQQVALENSRAANTMNLANLSNRQAGIMAEAAAVANMDMANLNNRQQAAVQNAQNFLAMDMANLDREQQTALFKSQQNVQALFTDQAAENAALQFNASSENQTKQFFASLSSQTSQFNAAQTNSVNQFNVNSVNAVREFNANLQQQRDQFNATNGLVVAQANAQWRQNIATLNTAAQNESNMTFATAINSMTQTNLDAVWQRERDIMSLAFQTAESNANNATQILLQQMAADATVTAAELQAKIEATSKSGDFLSEVFLKIIDF